MPPEPATNVRVASGLRPTDAVLWLQERPGGALCLVVTSARGCGVEVRTAPDAEKRLQMLAESALAGHALRALAWHAEGFVPEGAPIAVVAACCEHRKDATRLVDAMLVGLKGLSTRTDVPDARS